MDLPGRYNPHVLLLAGLAALLKILDHLRTLVKPLYRIFPAFAAILRLCGFHGRLNI